jgi:membrane associated rhomboid family serine protease
MKDDQKFLPALLYPLLFVSLLWLIKVTEHFLQIDFTHLGIYPLRFSGLLGIVFAPVIHGSFQHLISNTLPLIILGWALFYFYPELGLRITILSWLFTGIWVWSFARFSYHIGASGIIYSWAAFLFVSGIIRKHPRLMALSLLVIFLYGSLIWGIFPLKERISWEGHLMGMVSGVVLALYYRQAGLQRKKYSWELEEEPEDDSESPYWQAEEPQSSQTTPTDEQDNNQVSTK